MRVLLAVPVEAGHCTTWTTTEPDATIPDPFDTAGGDLYLIAPAACIIMYDIVECGGIWVCQETNGLAGLQRADQTEDDTCHGMIDGDTVVV